MGLLPAFGLFYSGVLPAWNPGLLPPRSGGLGGTSLNLGLPNPRAPSVCVCVCVYIYIYMIPTLGPEVDKWGLLWAILSPQAGMCSLSFLAKREQSKADFP